MWLSRPACFFFLLEPSGSHGGDESVDLDGPKGRNGIKDSAGNDIERPARTLDPAARTAIPDTRHEASKGQGGTNQTMTKEKYKKEAYGSPHNLINRRRTLPLPQA